MKIHVTADHIAGGTRTACQHCPVALAYTEATGHTCSVEPSAFRLGEGILRDLITTKIYDLPGWLIQAIKDFDAGGMMEPFSFDL